MSRPRPPSQDCIKDIIGRLDLLKKVGVKDLPVNTEEASAITGLSQETLRRYGTLDKISTFKYPHRNLYPLRELCEWALKHYHRANSRPKVRPGRPAKKGV